MKNHFSWIGDRSVAASFFEIPVTVLEGCDFIIPFPGNASLRHTSSRTPSGAAVSIQKCGDH
jgi:hypothetical protein